MRLVRQMAISSGASGPAGRSLWRHLFLRSRVTSDGRPTQTPPFTRLRLARVATCNLFAPSRCSPAAKSPADVDRLHRFQLSNCRNSNSPYISHLSHSIATTNLSASSRTASRFNPLSPQATNPSDQVPPSRSPTSKTNITRAVPSPVGCLER